MTPQQVLTDRYRAALNAWRFNASLRATCGMHERAYCDWFIVTFGPITWTASTTTLPVLDYDAAYAEAR